MLSSMQELEMQELLERLYDRAEFRISRFGPKNLRMDDLARDLGVSKKTIYSVVESKDALISGIIGRFIKELRQNMETLCASTSIPFEAKFDQHFKLISGALSRFDERVFSELERYYPSIYEWVEQVRRETLPEVLRRLIVQGQQVGYVREDLNLEVFSEAFLQAVQGMFRTNSMNVHKLKPHEIPLALSELFIRAIWK